MRRPRQSPSMFRSLLLLLCLWLLAALLPRAAQAYDASAVFDAKTGTLPLLLTVPHDGAEFLGLFPHRTKGVTACDVGSRELAERVADHLEKQTGRRPYLVIAKVSRRQMDVYGAEVDAVGPVAIRCSPTAATGPTASMQSNLNSAGSIALTRGCPKTLRRPSWAS